MKNLILFFFFSIAICKNSWSQNLESAGSKYIDVTGSAEMEIIPDEIYFKVILQEYLNKEKSKVEIGTLEKELQNSVNEAGIAKENLQVENVYGHQWTNKKKKPTEFFAKKTYVIKLTEPSKIDGILNKIESEGINSVFISSYSHSKIQQFKKDLQIKAIQNAKEKATYLLAAINEQIGGVKYIYDNRSNNEPIVWDLNPVYASNTRSGLSYNSESGFSSDEISFKTIKLRFEVNAQFYIK